MGGATNELTHWVTGEHCCDPRWERAYERFESDAQELRKFVARLLAAGARGWPRDSRVVELFCGRGNGLRALEQLGFTRLEGVDLSPHLLARYRGPARLYVGDCRELRFERASKDLVVVQGGLHHLLELPGDLDRVLSEARRVLRPGGRLVVVEPWPTPFLSLVHTLCKLRPARRVWGKLDALATMIEHERQTYENWLRQPDASLERFEHHFVASRTHTAWGKLHFVGTPRA